METNKYSLSLENAIKLAKQLAQQRKHTNYGVPHLVITMLNSATGLKETLTSLQKDVSYILEWFDTHLEMYSNPNDEYVETPAEPDEKLSRVFEEAERSKIKLGTDNIDALCVFCAVCREGVVYSRQQIDTLGVTEDDLLNYFNAVSPTVSYQMPEDNRMVASFPFAENFKTEEVLESGKIVVGRDKEIRKMLECLERSENKGIMIVGAPGIGKSAIIKAFVKEICENEDEIIQQIAVFSLNAAKLIASTSNETEIAQKFIGLMSKINQLEKTSILVIDDLQVLLENSAFSKASVLINILNAQITDGAAHLLLSITSDAFRKHIEKHPIESRLDIIKVGELEPSALDSSLNLHKKRIENYYGLKFNSKCIEHVVQLSKRYFKEKCLPTAAIDLLDRTAASVRLSNKNTASIVAMLEKEFQQITQNSEAATPAKISLLYHQIYDKNSVVVTSKLSDNNSWNNDDPLETKIERVKNLLDELKVLQNNEIKEIALPEIEAIVSEATDIPIGKIQSKERDRLLGIETKLQKRVKGQTKAITTLSDAIIESRSGLSDTKKPIGSFFFLGPTGTGKTELTKALAELLFDKETSMIRFDMSEFKEEHSAALLYGAPPGYVGYEEGGLLVTQIRQKPYSVVLFDEIEKAHQSVYDVFLQMMDEGKIHDKLGREGDFSNSIIIFTSNIGSQWIAEQFQAGKVPDSRQLVEIMSEYFRPEFLGRLTEVVPFAPINENVAKEIFMLHFSRLQEMLLKQKNINLNISDAALQFLASKGFSPKYGARPIEGVIRTYIKKVVSKLIVAEKVKPGDNIILNFANNELSWESC